MSQPDEQQAHMEIATADPAVAIGQELSAETVEELIRPEIPIQDYVRRQRMVDLGFCPQHTGELVTLVASETDSLVERRCPKCDFVYRERTLAVQTEAHTTTTDNDLHDRES
jgi:hypothetical protein